MKNNKPILVNNYIFCICKCGWDNRHQYRADNREFLDQDECRKEAKKIGGFIQILACKDEYGYWHKIQVEW